MPVGEAIETLRSILGEMTGTHELSGLDPDEAFEMGFSLAITELERLTQEGDKAHGINTGSYRRV